MWKGTARMSVRASYGVSFEEIPLQDRHGDTSGQPPWGMELLVPFPASLDDPWRDVPGGNPFPLRLARDVRFVPLGNYESQTYDITPMYTQSWNLTVQREVAPNTAALGELYWEQDNQSVVDEAAQSGRLCSRCWRQQRKLFP